MRVIGRIAVAVALGWAASAAQADDAMSVQVRQAPLRSDPSFLGRLVGQAAYGERVAVQRAQADWRLVSTPGGVEGWVHQSALTPKKLVMKSGATDVQQTASGEELALAGKGFNSDVEADFKKKNANIDFTWIDRMEKIKVSANEMTAFLKDGQVHPQQ